MRRTEATANLHTMVRDKREEDTFAQDVLHGLTRPTGEKFIPAKHLYDAEGSRLFERILDTRDYYPVDVEAEIFDEQLDAIADRLGPDVVLVEPGAGDGRKPERLLDRLDSPRAFAPVEISESALAESSERIARAFPEVEVRPVCADFVHGFAHVADLPADNRVVFFPGSTIGNFLPEERVGLLRAFTDYAGDDGRLLVGFDLVKERDALRAAYDDSEDVTAAFNLNLVTRMNSELDAGFDEDAFAHEAVWVEDLSRIEMRLVLKRPQRVEINGRRVSLEEGERIHTENSHKFTMERIAAEAARADLEIAEAWTDPREWYALVLLQRAS